MVADDGSDTVSQSVTWSAKFVDRISEVTDSMNVSGTSSGYLTKAINIDVYVSSRLFAN